MSPFVRHSAEHRIQPNTVDIKNPLAFFKPFDTEFNTFSTNTKVYAASKGAKVNTPSGVKKRRLSSGCKHSRLWNPTTPKVIMVWLGLIIVIGLVKTGAKNS